MRGMRAAAVGQLLVGSAGPLSVVESGKLLWGAPGPGGEPLFAASAGQKPHRARLWKVSYQGPTSVGPNRARTFTGFSPRQRSMPALVQ